MSDCLAWKIYIPPPRQYWYLYLASIIIDIAIHDQSC